MTPPTGWTSGLPCEVKLCAWVCVCNRWSRVLPRKFNAKQANLPNVVIMQSSDHQGWRCHGEWLFLFNFQHIVSYSFSAGQCYLEIQPNKLLLNLWSTHENHQGSRAERKLRSGLTPETTAALPWTPNTVAPECRAVTPSAVRRSWGRAHCWATGFSRSLANSQYPWPQPLCNWPPSHVSFTETLWDLFDLM